MSLTIPQVGDEEGFLNYEEKVIYDLQKTWYSKPGMEGCAVVSICEQLDNLIYGDALKEYNLSDTANVWSKRECLLYYCEKCEALLRNMEIKDLNWKKLYDDSRMNARHVLHTIMKTGGERRSKGGSNDAYKAAARALMPKARKSALGFTASEAGPKRKSIGKQRSGKGGKSGVASNLPNNMSYSANLGAYMEGGDFESNTGLNTTATTALNGDDGGSGLIPGIAEEGGLDDFGFNFTGEDLVEESTGGMLLDESVNTWLNQL